MKLSELKAAQKSVNLLGKSALIVGGTSGIGEGIAYRLARANIKVTIAGRNETKGVEIVDKLNSLSPDPQVQHSFKKVDAALLANVSAFVQDFKLQEPSLDYLILTQGIATIQGFTPTSEGLDMKLALHYYSRVAFAQGLALLLEKSCDGRVMTVLSAGIHKPFTRWDSDPALEQKYSISDAANAAGLYNDILVDKLHEAHPTLACIHVEPGFVASSWGTEMPAWIRYPVRVLQAGFGTSIEDCGEYLAQGIFREDLKGSLQLLSRDGRPAKRTSEHEKARDPVWQHTQDILQKYDL